MSDRDAFEKCTRPCMNRHPIFLSESSASSAATVTRFSPLDHHPRSLGALFSRHLCRARQAALEATALTAAGSLPCSSGVGSLSSTWPVAISTIKFSELIRITRALGMFGHFSSCSLTRDDTTSEPSRVRTANESWSRRSSLLRISWPISISTILSSQ